MKLLKKYIHLLLLLCILILSFKIRYINAPSLADLKPWRDAAEYSLSAYNLYHYHIYGFKLYEQYYPPLYPFGYPLLIIPFYIIFGSQPYKAVYCSLFFSLLSIVFAYLIGKELGNRFTGIIAAMFVALCPMHIEFSKYIMTEASSAFFVLFICWLLLKAIYLDSKKQGILLLFLGLITGFSVSVHMGNCLLIPAVLISFLLGRKSNTCSVLKNETIILLGIILALMPLFLYQFHTFGSPLRTGYQALYTEYFGKFKCFSFKFFAHPPPHTQDVLTRGNFLVYLFTLTGLEKHFYPASMIPLLLGGALFIISKRREHNKQIIFLIFSSILVTLLLVFFSLYRWQDSRFILRGIPLLMILAACGVTFLKDKWIVKSLTKGSIFNITILSLFLITIIQMALWSYSHPKRPWIGNHEFILAYNINRHVPNNAVIISEFNPIISGHYFTEQIPDERVHISLSNSNYWAELARSSIKPIRYDSAKKYSFLFLSDGTLNPRTYNFIRLSIKKGIPVYLVYFPHHPVYKKFLPFIKKYFRIIEYKGDRRLFRLYLKDW